MSTSTIEQQTTDEHYTSSPYLNEQIGARINGYLSGLENGELKYFKSLSWKEKLLCMKSELAFRVMRRTSIVLLERGLVEPRSPGVRRAHQKAAVKEDPQIMILRQSAAYINSLEVATHVAECALAANAGLVTVGEAPSIHLPLLDDNSRAVGRLVFKHLLALSEETGSSPVAFGGTDFDTLIETAPSNQDPYSIAIGSATISARLVVGSQGPYGLNMTILPQLTQQNQIVGTT